MDPENVTVSTIDDLSDVAHSKDQPRNLGDYKSTNMPLSAAEIAHDESRDTAHEGWAPRTTENIGDMLPLPEKPALP